MFLVPHNDSIVNEEIVMPIKEVALSFRWRLSAHCETRSSVNNDEQKGEGAEAADTR
jgi:hypothetical protein